MTAMVALDGSAFAQAALEPTATLVCALASPAQGALLLTRVVRLAPEGTESQLNKQAVDEAQAYLDQVERTYAATAQKLNVTLTTAVARGFDVADTLIRAAQEGEQAGKKGLTGTSCDLIAMTTHGRSGLQRLTMGSVTERVLGTTLLPVLVVHHQTPSEADSAATVSGSET
jgi:nucleotide-binding universal stress UspA family protein